MYSGCLVDIMAEDNIVIRVTTPEDCDSVLDFMREHFYPEEPLTISFEPRKQDAHDEKSNMEYVRVPKERSTCLVAISGDQIVGALITGPKGVDWEEHLLKEASRIPGTKWAKVLLFLAFLERKTNTCEKYKVDKAIQSQMLGVHKKFRGKGIGLRLYQKCLERAKDLGYPVFTAHCSSVYSARLCERLGMDCVNVFPINDFRLPGSDEQVFHSTGIHQFVRTFAKRV